MPAPILVTGSHRSGTTWVGRMLALAGDVAYVHEPFNPIRAPGWIGMRLPHWYLYVCPENEEPYVEAVQRVLDLRYPLARDVPQLPGPRQAGQAVLEWARSVPARLRASRVLIKDPIALFSSEWLAKRFGMEPVVMIRHPAAFAGSLKRLGWTFDFRNWAAQDLLMRDLLAPFEARIRAYAAEPPGIVDQAILMWNAIHHVVRGLRERHPGWTFVRYEDLADAPLAGFEDLYRRLALPWREAVRRDIERYSSERNAGEVPTWLHRTVKRDSREAKRTWVTRLTAAERERIREGTSEVAEGLYGEQDWR